MLPDNVGWLSCRDKLWVCAKKLLCDESFLLLVSILVVAKALGIVDGLSLTIVRLKSYERTYWSC